MRRAASGDSETGSPRATATTSSIESRSPTTTGMALQRSGSVGDGSGRIDPFGQRVDGLRLQPPEVVIEAERRRPGIVVGDVLAVGFAFDAQPCAEHQSKVVQGAQP